MYILTQSKRRIYPLIGRDRIVAGGTVIWLECENGEYILGKYETVEDCSEVITNMFHAIQTKKETYIMPEAKDIHLFVKTMKGEN
jgi:ornithine carbamoyltransferase